MPLVFSVTVTDCWMISLQVGMGVSQTWICNYPKIGASDGNSPPRVAGYNGRPQLWLYIYIYTYIIYIYIYTYIYIYIYNIRIYPTRTGTAPPEESARSGFWRFWAWGIGTPSSTWMMGSRKLSVQPRLQPGGLLVILASLLYKDHPHQRKYRQHTRHGSLNVPMFHITQPKSVYDL